MPSTRIEVMRAYDRDTEVALIEAVQSALVETLRIPETDRAVRLVVHEPHRVILPPDRDDRFTLVEVDLFSGRSYETKKALYAAVVRNLAPFDIPADHVKILLREIPREDWGLRGLPATEIELGFRIDV